MAASSFGSLPVPQQARKKGRRLLSTAPTHLPIILLVAAAAFAAGLLFTRNLAPSDGHPGPYAAALLFGSLVGITELVARYRDRPMAPLGMISGWVYVAVNGLASGLALWLIRDHRIAAATTLLNPTVAQVMLAGFGTMAFFRTSLFTLRVGESDVAIGPAAVLQVILNAADRECDRMRAGPRSERVIEIIRGVSFERARSALPLHCFALMQNLSLAEQQGGIQGISTLSGTKDMSDEVKVYNMGLLLMNVVGEDVLRRAVSALGTLIKGAPKDDPPILARAVSLRQAQVARLLDLCTALAPQCLGAQTIADRAAELEKATARVDGDAERNVITLANLREQFGSETLAQALNLLVACASPVRTTNASITVADLEPVRSPSFPPPAGPAVTAPSSAPPGPAAVRPPNGGRAAQTLEQPQGELRPRPEIRILGWDSLLWEPEETSDKTSHQRQERYPTEHDEWERLGPNLPLEFSRISRSRNGALTLVIDRDHGSPVEVWSARSRRSTLEDAIKDLTEREKAESEQQIGFVDCASGTHRGRDEGICKAIEDWAKSRGAVAVIWADFEPNFERRTKRPWSIEHALDYIRSLRDDARAEARKYIRAAPELVRTAFREAAEKEEKKDQPWAKSQP